ncbi:MAG: hypothetical protein IH989_02405 [Planctomycetes bacterium]|nr:hypothetical protein [Planctomycetota bacterium]
MKPRPVLLGPAVRRAQRFRHGSAPRRPRVRVGRLTVVMCLGLVGSTHAVAQPTQSAYRPLSEVVPHDAVAAYFAEPPSSQESPQAPWSALKLATFVADRANQAGLLSSIEETSRQWIDLAAALSVVFDHPHAVALLDVKARSGSDDGHELAALQAALIIRTDGDNKRITERIQHLLGVYTNTQYASLSEQSAGDMTWFSLRDARLGDWAVIAWGAYGDYYVVVIGEGAFERIVATIRDPKDSLRHDAWFARAVRQTAAPMTGDGTATVGLPTEPSYAWYVRFDRLRRSSDAGFDAKVQWVQFSLGLAGVDRGLWMAAQSPATGSVEVVGVHRQKDRDTLHRLAGEFAGADLPDDAVPDLVVGFAVIDCIPSAVWRGASNAYLGSRGSNSKERCELGFDRIEEESGVSVEQDILSLLGGPVVIHNYPRHALRLPLAWTLVVPVRGDPRVLRDRVDKVLRAVQRQQASENGVQLVRTTDGIWHLQYGLAGPALAITDRWLVLSFSPYAVRQNLALLTRQSDRP